MGFKFPSAADLVFGAAQDRIQMGSNESTVGRVTDGIIQGGVTSVQTALNNGINGLSSKFGVNLGLPSVDQIFGDPGAALSTLFNAGRSSTTRAGWYPLIQARPDPLLEIDWVPEFPLGLAAEYVEEMQFSPARFNVSSGIYQNGSHFFMIESIETAPIQVTFYEDRLMTVTNWLEKWRTVISPDGKHINYQSVYKKPIKAYLKDVKGTTVGVFTFGGCMPTTFPQVSLSSDSSNRIRLQVEFSVDAIRFQGLNVTQGSSTPNQGVVGGSLQTVASSVLNSLEKALPNTLRTLRF